MNEHGDRPIIILLQAGIELVRFLVGLLLVLFAMFSIMALAMFLGWNFELSSGVVLGSFVILIAVRLIGNHGGEVPPKTRGALGHIGQFQCFS